jgi:hypothetical protein
MNRQARILLLCDRGRYASTVAEHIDSFRRYSRHQVWAFNPVGLSHRTVLDFDDFDVVVIHYSIHPSDGAFVSPSMHERLSRFRGLKIQFIQDEYRWVDRATAATRELGVSVLFTVAPEPAASQLYDERVPGVRRVLTLTGYAPENLGQRPEMPVSKRPIDVGYRGRDLPFWFGRLSREKVWIGERFLELAATYPIRCDIAWKESDRIYGRKWVDFLSSCRATLGTESGASIADFDGSVERAVRAYLGEHPNAPFDEVHQAILRPYEGNVVVNVISPRVFEAASLGTALVMFPGRYSGVVSPGEHYIQIDKDFSNLADVVERIRDTTLIATMTARAHDELIKSGRWSYSSFIGDFDRVVDEEATVVHGGSASPRYHMARVERVWRVPGPKVRFLRLANGAYRLASGRDSPLLRSLEGISLGKVLLALRTALGDRDLLRLLRNGRRQGVPQDRLLREILQLSLLKRAIGDRLPHGKPFIVSTRFDPTRRALSFISSPVTDVVARHSSPAEQILDAVRARELLVVEWDHRALGGSIKLGRRSRAVAIGSDGLETFDILVQIGRREPVALERVLAPLLSGIEMEPSTIG